MNAFRLVACSALFLLGLNTVTALGQSQTPTITAPGIVRLDGQLLTAQGEPRTGPVVMRVSLYATQEDAAPLWFEDQNVTLDQAGRYTVFAGAAQAGGLPPEFFATNAAQWVGLGVVGEPELPRTRLLAVPYAMSAGNADSLGGTPATEFVMSQNLAERVKKVLTGVDSTAGTANDIIKPMVSTVGFIPKFSDTNNTTINSYLFETGDKIGLGTTSPISLFHMYSATNGGTNLFTLENANADAYGPMFLAYKNSASPANGDTMGYFVFWGKNGSGTRRDFGTLLVASDDVANGSEDSSFRFWNFVGGAEREVMTVKTGNLGVGNTNPTAAIHISANSASANPFIRMTDTNTGGRTFSVGPVSSPSSFDVHDATAGAYRLTINSSGNVGIGTTAPTAKLQVAGDVVVDGNIGAKYQDVAEWVDSTEEIEAGTVVIVDPAEMNHVIPSPVAYDTRVAGAVSRQPGLILGERGEGKSLVAQSGRVRIKVDATFGAIRPGDLLVTSPTPGHAMLSKPMKIGGQLLHRPGTLVGKALEGLPNGRGEILVLLTLQ